MIEYAAKVKQVMQVNEASQFEPALPVELVEDVVRAIPMNTRFWIGKVAKDSRVPFKIVERVVNYACDAGWLTEYSVFGDGAGPVNRSFIAMDRPETAPLYFSDHYNADALIEAFQGYTKVL